MKKTGKNSRKQQILFGLIDLYSKTGQPVGSNTLKEAGFSHLSSATIRNYFARLEEEELLAQQHTSGGRLPTHAAYRLYAKELLSRPHSHYQEPEAITTLRNSEGKEISAYLQNAAETLSHLSECAIFLSAPRFDHDFISSIKLLAIDAQRCLCVIITDFGVIQTELFHSARRLNAFMVKRMEQYFQCRLRGDETIPPMEPEEEETAQTLYNEMMIRYIVGYSHFADEEVYRTGFAHMLRYPEFHDPSVLANSLTLFENAKTMRLLLREASAHDRCSFWIGDDLEYYANQNLDVTILAIPYHIHQQVAGAVGLLGPARMPYEKHISLLEAFADAITQTLTKIVYKFKIRYRQPHVGEPYIPKEEHRLIGQSRLMLLEKKTGKE